MKLKELLMIVDFDTPVVVYDNTGPYNELCTMKELPAYTILGSENRKVKKIFLDTSDNSLSIELYPLDWEENWEEK